MTSQTWRVPCDGPAVMLVCADCGEWDGLVWWDDVLGVPVEDSTGCDVCPACWLERWRIREGVPVPVFRGRRPTAGLG